MKFKLEINLGNSAMRDVADLIGALEKVRKHLYHNVENDELKPKLNGQVLDVNGNSIGSWRVTR
jgi:hypothetical protein